jgi:hypothetical protein
MKPFRLNALTGAAVNAKTEHAEEARRTGTAYSDNECRLVPNPMRQHEAI